MVERKGLNISPKDLVFLPAFREQVVQQFRVGMLYDKQGRTVWRTSRDEEVNAARAIANVQILFLQACPEFNELFPLGADGSVVPGNRQAAAEFVSERLHEEHGVSNLLKVTAIEKKSTTPIFEGSYMIAVQRTFAAWGVEISDSDFPIRPDGYWTPQRIIDESLGLLERDGAFSQDKLIAAGRSDLVYAIRRYYPGGLNAVQREIGNAREGKSWGYWTPEKVEEEVRLFVADGKRISEKRLQTAGRGDLAAAPRLFCLSGL